MHLTRLTWLIYESEENNVSTEPKQWKIIQHFRVVIVMSLHSTHTEHLQPYDMWAEPQTIETWTLTRIRKQKTWISTLTTLVMIPCMTRLKHFPDSSLQTADWMQIHPAKVQNRQEEAEHKKQETGHIICILIIISSLYYYLTLYLFVFLYICTFFAVWSCVLY